MLCHFQTVVLQPATRIPLQQGHTETPTHIEPKKKIRPNVMIQQYSRRLLMMYILMSETCWAHNKWNKIASDIKLVFYSSTITMMHGPINIRLSTVALRYFTNKCLFFYALILSTKTISTELTNNFRYPELYIMIYKLMVGLCVGE